MTLCKYTSGKCGYDYLHTGKVEVDSCDDEHGIISLATQPWSQSRRSNGVILEFEVPDGLCLPRMVCTRNGDRVVQVDLSDCELIDSSHLYKLSDDFNLKTFIIGVDCQMRWQFARSWLKKMGKGDAVIKILKTHPENGVVIVDEEYRMDDQGLYCLKWNPNHPHERDKTCVEDVDCVAPAHCLNAGRESFTRNNEVGHLPLRLYKYMSTDFGLDVLRTKQIKVTTLLDVNDPNEWIPVCPNPKNNVNDYLSDPRLRSAFRHFWACQHGFISLSSSWNNPLLWGHYADKFRGVALVFEVCTPSKVKEVKYCDTRYVLDEKEMYSGDREKIDRLVSRKAKVWEYEQEYRTLVDLRACTTQHHGNDTLFFANIKDNGCLRLCGIYMGPECTATVYDVHSALDRKPPIGFERIQLAPDSRTYGIIKCDSKVWNGTNWASMNEI